MPEKVYKSTIENFKHSEEYLLKLGYRWGGKYKNEKINLSMDYIKGNLIFFKIWNYEYITWSTKKNYKNAINLDRILKIKKLK